MTKQELIQMYFIKKAQQEDAQGNKKKKEEEQSWLGKYWPYLLAGLGIPGAALAGLHFGAKDGLPGVYGDIKNYIKNMYNKFKYSYGTGEYDRFLGNENDEATKADVENISALTDAAMKDPELSSKIMDAWAGETDRDTETGKLKDPLFYAIKNITTPDRNREGKANYDLIEFMEKTKENPLAPNVPFNPYTEEPQVFDYLKRIKDTVKKNIRK
mgnify:CR=1 FL=1